MDPFYATSTPAAGSKRHPRRAGDASQGELSTTKRKEPQPSASVATPNSSASKSPSGLRRSAGLFNLKLNAPKPNENEEDAPVSPHVPPSVAAMPAPAMSAPAGPVKAPFGRVKSDKLSLKRPHPFSAKPQPKQWGFLSRSSSSATSAMSNSPPHAGSKRMHLPSELEDHSETEVSFREAKPVQTAFTSCGLMSKKHAPQTPRPRVPETPVKRPLPAQPIDQGSPFPAQRAPHPGNNRLDRLDMSSTDSLDARLKLSNVPNTPIDRLNRFSISQIDETDIPQTPTKFSGWGDDSLSYFRQQHTNISTSSIPNRRASSTPCEPYFHPVGSSSSTATPGTIVKAQQPRAVDSQVLRSVDPSDSLSMSPLWSRDTISFNDSSAGPHTPAKFDGITSPAFTVDPRSSPLPKQRLRHLGLRSAEKSYVPTMPASLRTSASHMRLDLDNDEEAVGLDQSMVLPIPPLKLETRHLAMDSSSPKTPASGSFFSDSPPLRGYQGVNSHSDPSSRSSSIPNELEKDEGSMFYDAHLASKFDRVLSTTHGEFSNVMVVMQGRQRFAVKRTKRAMVGPRARQRQSEEIDVLRALQSNNDAHVIEMIDAWEHANYGYIMTEYCENGDLNAFLAAQGRVSRLEEWRVWKIMVEILHGLAVVHSHNILHLDLKPANVFVTFEGHLKIGDFGMATFCPTPPGFEREGDREYIAPEVLEKHQYGKPADIFSVGLMIVEVAANIVLPDNGVHWHRLRSGDLSDAGRLSSGDLAHKVVSSSTVSSSSPKSFTTTSTATTSTRDPSSGTSHNNSSLLCGTCKQVDVPSWAPRFLVDGSCLLDHIVSLMLSPQPENRPTVAQLLTIPELMLVYQRGQAGAIVYEGDFGPEPDMNEENSVWQRT